jgi:hypothetical protein
MVRAKAQLLVLLLSALKGGVNKYSGINNNSVL